MENTLHPFQQFLKSRGLKSTRQRDDIVRTFLEAGAHLSAEEIYQRVRQRQPGIGYATVYRTLKLLSEHGLVSSRRFGERTARFEQRAEGKHHDHLICLRCGRIVEFESERIENLQSRIARRQGFRIFDHRLELYGHCAQCRQEKESPADGAREKERGVDYD